jgi:hypothetical protein
MRTSIGALHALVALSAVAVACGGSTFDNQADGGGTDGAPSSSGTGTSSGGTGVSGCPASPPPSGSSCSPAGLTCEWGTSNVPDCDTQETCAGGLWTLMVQGPGGLDCGGGPPIVCPASYGGVPVYQSCSPYRGYCDYPQGRCGCSPPATITVNIDGSFQGPFWQCQQPTTPGCPQPRPRLGSVCTQDGLTCEYGDCNEVPGGNAEVCRGGVWVTTVVACSG